ncbi:aminoglycoside phosphotransferase family protein [Streptomyces sp. NPDC047515]|uniref:aminoglycoside phosphotransferase family protein n=1 Tax=Streptomyces sp. NPDC047515 TaxID=3155380 RepID=UPI0033DB1E77
MIDIPDGLIDTQSKYNGAAGRVFLAALPGRAAEFLGRWGLRRDGEAFHGVCALVLPVVRVADGRPAALKLQPVDEETVGEPVALRVWGEAGAGAVELLDHDTATGTLLLERLDGRRSLAGMADEREAVLILAGLLARLSSVPAPVSASASASAPASADRGLSGSPTLPGPPALSGSPVPPGPPALRGLGEMAARMLQEAPGAVAALADEEERRLLADCAAAVCEVAGEPGDRLLHWDLHYGNVLAGREGRWVAIDPKPLVGDPAFELLPALVNRFDAAAVRWRFDVLTQALGLDRERTRAWTLGRLLQNGLWDVSDGQRRLAPDQAEIARQLLGRGRPVTGRCLR